MTDESNYIPSGELQGKNTGPLPDRGTRTGMGDNAQTDGMSLEADATNREGSMAASTKSTPAMDNMPPGPGSV